MRALACTLGVMIAVTSWSAPAAALDITFDEVVSTGNPLVTTLDTVGYRLRASAFRTIDTPGGAFASNGSAVYIGLEAGSSTGLTVSRIDGGPFLLYEFDAAGLLLNPSAGSPNAQQVSLLGRQTSGALLTASHTLGTGPATFAHFVVPASWQSLEAVTFIGLVAGGSGGLALDDIGVGLGPIPSVPEPSTILLAMTTALGIGASALARRRRRRLR